MEEEDMRDLFCLDVFLCSSLLSHRVRLAVVCDHACVWPADPLFSSLGLRLAA